MTEGGDFTNLLWPLSKSLPVLVVAYLFSFVTGQITPSWYIYCIFVAFYVSDNQDYFKRGRSLNFEMQLVLHMASHQFFELLFGGEVLSLPPGMIYFLFLLTLVLYLMNYFIKRY